MSDSDAAAAGGSSNEGEREGAGAVPGQPPGVAAPPVPTPGAAPGTTVPAVQAAQGASPDDGISAGDKDAGSDASVSSPGAWTATAPPGKPDGEVDTRSL